MYIQVVLQAQEVMQPASASTGQEPGKPVAQVGGCCAVQRCRVLHGMAWHCTCTALHLVRGRCAATAAPGEQQLPSSSCTPAATRAALAGPRCRTPGGRFLLGPLSRLASQVGTIGGCPNKRRHSPCSPACRLLHRCCQPPPQTLLLGPAPRWTSSQAQTLRKPCRACQTLPPSTRAQPAGGPR